MDDLGGFLKSRRARVTPQSAGLEPGARRRVAGLRREEVALLAGISVEYYVRLEQGRSTAPSEEVLDAIARALRLDEVERAHLGRLARPARRTARPRGDRVRPQLLRLLALVDRAPAMIINHRADVLAANALATALFPPDVGNGAKFVFGPGGRDLYVDWDSIARDTVGQLRLAVGQYPGDRKLASLIGELSMGNEDFRRLWAARDVRMRTQGTKRLRHPLVGELELGYESFEVAEAPGQRLITLIPEPDSPSEAALALLGSWNAVIPDTPRASPPGRPA
ncbi:helix-turn-helix transcriptional regulator [Nonomuraea sediminis]|uniref:helix-turn-helix transcriptional regulator n=1 Tax=Nonomuraea sediminis TaxID=2835864 RepID=UPI001BDD6C38|nr:helix-turn-helix transcriptional regulator [Nonomuraea sediminis]